MLAAREDLVNRLLDVAGRKNVKLFAMINDILELVLRADEMGISLEETVNEYGFVKAAKDAGFVPAVESLWYDVIEKFFKLDKDWLINKWYKSGKWYGKYYSVKLPADPLNAFKKEIGFLTWDASEFDIVENEDGKMEVRCVNPRFSMSYSTLFSKFLEGALNAFGYECIETAVTRGLIHLLFRRGEGQ